jgi:drug/metabolite transporter (DMT)-like permease
VTLLYAAVTAVTWGCAELVFLRAAKAVGGYTASLWTAIFGLVLTLPIAIATGTPSSGSLAFGLAIGGALVGVAGSLLYALAIQHGQLTIVSPVVSAQAGVSALLAVVILGERLSAPAALAVVGATLGVVLTAWVARGGTHGLASVLAMLSALSLGGYNLLLADSADAIGPIWAIIAFRIASVAVFAPLAAARGQFRLVQESRRWLALSSVLETIGFSTLAIALARGPVAVVAVIAAQFPVIAVTGGAYLFRERLRGRQWAGVALVLASVAVLSASGN